MQIAFDGPEMQNAASMLRKAQDAIGDNKSWLSDVILAQNRSKWGDQWGPLRFMGEYMDFLGRADKRINDLLEALKSSDSGMQALQRSVTENDEGASDAYKRTQQSLPTYQPSSPPTPPPPTSGPSPIVTPQ